MKVRAWDIVRLNTTANIIKKIMENVAGGAKGAQTSDSTSRMLNTSTSIWRKSWVPWLDCKDNSDLYAMVVVPVLSDTMYLHGPPLHDIAFF